MIMDRLLRYLVCLTILALILPANAYTPVNNLPACVNNSKRYTCGQKGILQSGAKGQAFNDVPNIDSCRFECLQRDCKSLSYVASTKVCTVFGKSLFSLGFKQKPSSAALYYSVQCFNCIQKCPHVEDGSNILVNPGFENPTSNFHTLSPWEDYYESSYSPAQAFSPGYNSATAAYGQGTIQLYQEIRPCLGQLYELTFNYKIEYRSTAYHHIAIRVGDISASRYIPTNSNNNTWLTFHDVFQGRGDSTFSNVTALVIAMDINAEGNPSQRISNFWIDNVAVTPTKTPLTVQAGAPELIANGGFENKSLTPFTVSGNHASASNFSFSSPGARGSQYALEYNPPASNGDSFIITISQTAATTVGARYILSFDYMIQAVAGGQCDVPGSGYGVEVDIYTGNQLLVSGARDAFLYLNAFNSNLPGVNKWITYSRPIYGLASYQTTGTPLQLTFMPVVASSPCPFYIDNISVKLAA